MHVGVLVIVAGFLWLGWWQLSRARSGNLLSYGYAIEWPVFAGFVVWIWIIEMRKALRATSPAARPADADPNPGPSAAPPPDPHPGVDLGQMVTIEDQSTTIRPRSTDERAGAGSRAAQATERRRRRQEAAYDDSDDPELRAYNHYLAWFNAHPHATPADYPGMERS